MNKPYIKLTVTLSVLLIIMSCKDISTEVKSWVDVDETSEVLGSYHILENDGIKVFLPEVFKRYSTAEYENVLDSLVSKKDFETEINRLKTLRELKGNFYIYFDDVTRSTFTVNTLPFMPLQKEDAQMLLGIVRQSNETMLKGTNLKFEKLKASYSSTTKLQVFKGVFKISNPKDNTETYQSNYFVSTDSKTFFIKLTTGYEVDFDPYFKKFIL
ncbi:hypothetical protein RM697_01140 [Ichthyenterobacterium sp. W332]|uniref:Lipoprotein n=1 Tax=Microcosmobacter mediterraneus TaxID=3075607 RepID=A0ABU2YH57_9FLAO|nr:hypothetical protein [Ichthyenterobacterium sp. W332]MDT0557231.1 hypothetical protein [Ichthyenterobacterium sp. W332]